MLRWKNSFNELADKMQSNIQDTVDGHMGVIGETLDMVRSENVALESESNPEFRNRVQEGMQRAHAEIERLQGLFAEV